jgi:PAS domain S-box-containing protein/putative nucleotidyltransferase with HDIG domain
MRVLVVDDDALNRQILRTVLVARGHEVVEAVDGLDALDAALSLRPDVIITDVFMPRLDGYQLCMRVREDPDLCDVPFVFYTAMYTDAADEQFALRLGADALLTKPAEPEIIVSTLESAAHHGAVAPPLTSADQPALLREYADRIVDRLARKVDELNVTNALLRESNDTLTALVESSPLGVALVSRECVVRMWNPAAERIFGWPADEVIGIRNPLLPSPDDTDCEFLAALQEGAVLEDQEMTRTRKDGTDVIISLSAAPLEGTNGDLLGFIVLMDDITTRKHQETELQATIARLERAMDGSVHVIAKLVETRDPYTAGHEERVATLAVAIAARMGLSDDTLREIRTAGIVHDIGKISVPAEILTKPTQLTDPEWSIIKVHPQVAYEILQVVDFDWPIADIVAQHHERIDGSGYPAGLIGADTLLEAKIIAVADVVEAMSSHRPYRPALGIDDALSEVTTNRGRLYDPDVVDACVGVFADGAFAF